MVILGLGTGLSFVSITTAALQRVFFFQAEDGIRDADVTGVQSVLFRSPPLERAATGSAPSARCSSDSRDPLRPPFARRRCSTRSAGRPRLGRRGLPL